MLAGSRQHLWPVMEVEDWSARTRGADEVLCNERLPAPVGTSHDEHGTAITIAAQSGSPPRS